MFIWPPHFGHLACFPAYFSPTLKLALHEGQEAFNRELWDTDVFGGDVED
jgi:hypothetical protein